MEYFNRHFYLKEKATVSQGIPKSKLAYPDEWKTLAEGLTALLVEYEGGIERCVAVSGTPESLSNLAGRLDGWGKDCAEIIGALDSEIATIQTGLRLFKRDVELTIRKLTLFPHTVTQKCSIEETLEKERL